MSRGNPNVYVGNISSRTRERDIQRKFDRYGSLRRCQLMGGFAFVEYEDSRDAPDAIRDLDGYECDGRRWQVQPARRPREGGRDGGGDRGRGGYSGVGGSGIKGGAVQGARKYCVLVKNLSDKTSWQELKDFARAAGYVEYTDIWTEGGKKRGVIKYENRDGMERALSELNDTRLDGNYVVLYAEDREHTRDRSVSASRSRSRSRGKGSRRRSRSRDRDDRKRRSISRSPDRDSRRR